MAADADPIQPTGQAHPLTDATLAALLALTPFQTAAADSLWQAHAPRAMAGLLALDGFTWDADGQQYVRPNGRPVADHTVRNALLLFLAAVAWDLEHAAEQVARGEVTLDHWRDTAGQTVRSAYVAAYAVGVGGLPNLTDAGRSAVRTRVADSLARLDRFAGLAQDRDDSVGTVAAAVARAALYANPAYGLFEDGRAEGHAAAGFTSELNVLDAGAEHCHECEGLTDQGWQPIGTLPLPGHRECGPGCRCRIDYARDAVPLAAA